MRGLSYLVITLVFMLASIPTRADVVDKLITPSENGFPAHEFYGIFWLWVEGTISAGRAEDEMEKLCSCAITTAERDQFVTLRANMVASAGQEWRRLARLEIAIDGLQTGFVTETEFRAYYGLPK